MVLLGVFGMGHFLRTVSVRNEVSSYSEPWWWLWLSVSVCLVIFAGVVSGLTLGLMSLWLMDLEVLQHSGSDEEKKQASMLSATTSLQPHPCGWLRVVGPAHISKRHVQ